MEAPQNSLRKIRIAEKDASERSKKYSTMRKSKEYKVKLRKNYEWLQKLDASDSKPKNGRVDISVFNANVTNHEYEIKNVPRKYVNGRITVADDVSIDGLAIELTDQYYAKKFGL